MEEVRIKRMLRELEQRYRDAQLETDEMREDEWETLKMKRHQEILEDMEKMSNTSSEYHRLKEAAILLHPYRIAWEIVSPYRTEILEAGAEEQKQILASIVELMAENTKMKPSGIRKYTYAFWPVPDKMYPELENV